MRDDDDSYERQDRLYTYPEWEGELTLKDKTEWYALVQVRETREPVLVDGKLCSQSTYTLQDAQVFPVVGDTYANDSLSGDALTAWLTQYGDEVANEVSEIQRDAWVEWGKDQADRY